MNEMNNLWLILSMVVLLFASALHAEDELPIIEETVDEIIILRTVGNQYARVVFVRDNQVLATRLLVDDMAWNFSGNGFQLEWQDYSVASRVVNAERFSLIVTDYDPTQADRSGPWWCQFRNMRDLQQP